MKMSVLVMLTGSIKVLSLMLKIKDNVDLAGLSLPLEDYRDCLNWPLDNCKASVSSNCLIALILPLEI